MALVANPAVARIHLAQPTINPRGSLAVGHLVGREVGIGNSKRQQTARLTGFTQI